MLFFVVVVDVVRWNFQTLEFKWFHCNDQGKQTLYPTTSREILFKTSRFPLVWWFRSIYDQATMNLFVWKIATEVIEFVSAMFVKWLFLLEKMPVRRRKKWTRSHSIICSVQALRDLMGPVDPVRAKTDAPDSSVKEFSIRHLRFHWFLIHESFRAIYGLDIMRNGFHASSNNKHAREEIRLLFPEYEIVKHRSILTGNRDQLEKFLLDFFMKFQFLVDPTTNSDDDLSKSARSSQLFRNGLNF